MSEESQAKKHRSLDEIKQNYTQVCARLGHVTYQLFAFQKDAEMIKEELQRLNLEAAAAAGAQQATAVEEKAEEVAQS